MFTALFSLNPAPLRSQKALPDNLLPILVVQRIPRSFGYGFLVARREVVPDLYGQPEEKQIEWARHPQMMKRMKEMRARQLAALQKPVTPSGGVLKAAPLPAPSPLQNQTLLQK